MSQQQQPSPVARVLVTGAIIWALVEYPPGPWPDPAHLWLWRFGALIAAIGAFNSLGPIAATLGTALRLRRALQPTISHGSAAWMSERELRRARLHRRHRGDRFIGIVGGSALWLWTETSHLILGPAGTSKTTAAIMNILMGSSDCAFITDIKGELWATTREYRTQKYRQRTVKIDPLDPENSVCINPLDPVAEALEKDEPRALTLTRGMALQLLPDPKGGGGSNAVFYQGGRVQMVTVMLAVCIVMPPEHRTMATVYRALSDLELLEATLSSAARSTVLNGEPADMARTMHDAFFGETGNVRTADSFRTNALLALEPFGPGNYLAKITGKTTFRFEELKESRVSLYLLIDYANSEVLAQFSGLMQFMAADALVRAGNNKPVLFVLDEFCNAPLHALPKILTLLRSAGVRTILATQDLDDITRVYSKHALETILSETDIKQILGGIRSKTTLEYFSALLGEVSEAAPSWTLGGPQVTQSYGRAARRLLTVDELRRLPRDAQIVFYGNMKPILAKKVQVFAVAPWRKKLGVNRIYGTRRKLSPVELRLRWWGSEVTPRARRAHARMARAVIRKGPSPLVYALRYLAKAAAPGALALLLLAVAIKWVRTHGAPVIW